MKIQFDDALPISARRDEIADAIAAHQVVVVAGETGSGKTTQLPKIALGVGRERIAHTQPRRIAARSVAKRIADEVGVELGTEVGYAVRFDDKSSADTRIRLVTDGLLLQEIHHDRELRRYDTIIVDEAHERSLSIDFLLGYLRQLLPRRPDLKVVITSATIDVDRFAALFDAPVIEVSGRTYPVEMRYRPLSDPDAGDLLDGISAAVEELPRDGDILVFLPGERDIRDVDEHLSGKKYRNTEILPLFGRLAAHDQQKIFASHPGRRIVLATNVAETSLTVPGIRYVIDPGLARISRYSQRLKVQRLPIEPISQASAAQRAGRCGRVADGICIRLYAEDDFEGRPEFTDPEIQRTNLASVIVQMAALDLGPIQDFGFLDPPDSRSVTDGVNLLRELNAVVDGKDGALRLTRLGRTMSRLPVDPRMARMIVAADRLGCLADVLVIVAAMSIQDPRERPLEKQQAADEKHARFRQPDSDFLSWLSLWTYLREQRDAMSHAKFRAQCKAEYLHYLRIREWQDVHTQLRRTVKDLGMKAGEPGSDPDTVHRALLTGLLSHVGLRESDGREFAGARGARFMVFPGSGLAKKPPAWVMAAELVETTRLWARTAARVQPEWIEEAAEHLVKRQYAEPHWSTKRGAAMARERVLLYGLPVVADRLVPLSRFDAPLARELFVRHALVQGEWRTNHAFWRHNQRLLEEVDALESRVRRRDLRIDDETLYAFYDERVPADVVSTRHFDGWWKKARRDRPDLLDLRTTDLVRQDAPDAEEFPTEWFSEGAPMSLTYTFEPGTVDDGVTVDVTLEQLPALDPAVFGWQVEGHRRELVEALIRSLPKQLRREFVPAPQVAGEVFGLMDPARGSVTAELARVLSARGGAVLAADDFDVTALPDHLRVKFRVLDGDAEVARGADLDELRDRLRPRLREQLQDATGGIERSGERAWVFGTVPAEVTAGRQTGYPAVVDETRSVGLKVLHSAVEQRAAGIRGQARLISFDLPSVVPAIGRTLDVRAKLTLQTGPYRDAAEVIEACWLAAIDHLVVKHGGPAADEEGFRALAEAVRPEVFDVTQRVLTQVLRAYERLGEVRPGDDEPGEDVKVQLSWLVYPGFVRDLGVERMPRLAVYLQAAAARLRTPGTSDDLAAAQDMEAEFHRRTATLSEWQKLSPDVQRIRWSLEELRVSLTAQKLGTAHPISLQRMRKQLDTLPTP
ncbi:ATP-dependent RNA helicase HrpA [Aeromicrobium alkaliterrae]|uniref:ATP-dependent RNA helicase HrpA n=1 Tax=Aeromicrobium alkaliterrae TaxID=302168 RepID=A0ABN2JKL9_9ACTN